MGASPPEESKEAVTFLKKSNQKTFGPLRGALAMRIAARSDPKVFARSF
jgi:hypothetical protein